MSTDKQSTLQQENIEISKEYKIAKAESRKLVRKDELMSGPIGWLHQTGRTESEG